MANHASMRCDAALRSRVRRGETRKYCAAEGAMPYLIGGFALLCGVLLLIHLFINGNPPRIHSAFPPWTGIVLAAAAIVALYSPHA